MLKKCCIYCSYSWRFFRCVVATLVARVNNGFFASVFNLELFSRFFLQILLQLLQMTQFIQIPYYFICFFKYISNVAIIAEVNAELIVLLSKQLLLNHFLNKERPSNSLKFRMHHRPELSCLFCLVKIRR